MLIKKPHIDLLAMRNERNWTQEDTAKHLGFSRSYYSEVEIGKQSISTRMMYAIIKVFGVQYEDFFKE